MFCALCQSGNEAEFTAEMMIHFSGLRNIDNPGVLTFAKVSVCLGCGSSRFTIPETELALLRRKPSRHVRQPEVMARTVRTHA